MKNSILFILGFLYMISSLAQPIGKFGGGDGGDFACEAINNQSLLALSITLDIKTILQGPYDTGTSLMDDDLRAASLIPMIEPYTALGYTHINGGGSETTTAAVLSVTGSDAIIDWVFIELRAAGDVNTVVATRAALLQRDGDIVEVDGVSFVQFPVAMGNYYVAIRHRNHLGVMTMSAILLN